MVPSLPLSEPRSSAPVPGARRRWLSPHPTCPQGRGSGVERGGEAELGLLPPSTAIISSSCRRGIEPAREGEGEQQENNSGYLPPTLQLEKGKRDRNVFAGQARNTCLSLPCTTTAHGSCVGAYEPWGLHPRPGLPPQVLLQWESPAPPAPTPKAKLFRSSHTGMGCRVSNTTAWLLFPAEKMGLNEFPPASPQRLPTAQPDSSRYE